MLISTTTDFRFICISKYKEYRQHESYLYMKFGAVFPHAHYTHVHSKLSCYQIQQMWANINSDYYNQRNADLNTVFVDYCTVTSTGKATPDANDLTET